MDLSNDECVISKAGNTALDDLLTVFNITDSMVILKLRKLLESYITECRFSYESHGFISSFAEPDPLVRFSEYYDFMNLKYYDTVVYYARQEKGSFIL